MDGQAAGHYYGRVQKIFIALSLSIFALALILTRHQSADAVMPAIANAAEISATSTQPVEQDAAPQQEQKPAAQAAPAPKAPAAAATFGYPVRLSMPAIGLNAPVIKVGVTASGDMDVPDGSTNNVGWYQYGTTPGEIGSAVIGAHVFAAFKNLNKARAGEDIYVVGAGGAQLHFKVIKTAVYALADLKSDMLFSRADGKYLNLITCAGEPTADGSTYTHRLVVYAALVE